MMADGASQSGGFSIANIVSQGVRAREHRKPPIERVGSFRLLHEIGRGSYGVVYQAEQDRPRRMVAVKLLVRDVLSPKRLGRFELEAEALGRLQHTGIAQVIESGIVKAANVDTPYIALEFVDGHPVTDFAQANAASQDDRIQLFLQICDAVQHAHQRGVVHRDLKPGNILVQTDGIPKVLDFGLARLTDESAAGSDRHTLSGQRLGTLQYMSPEQVLGKVKEIDTRSDVYALGVILFQLLNERLPYDLTGLSDVEAARVITEHVPALAGPARSNDLHLIVAKAIEKEPNRRYATVADMAEDLRRYLRQEPIVARPPSTWYRFSRFTSRNRALVGGVAATVATFVVGFVAVAWIATQRDQALRLATKNELDAEANKEVAEENAEKARMALAQRELALASSFEQAGDWTAAAAAYAKGRESGDIVAALIGEARAHVYLYEDDLAQRCLEELAKHEVANQLGIVEHLRGQILLHQEYPEQAAEMFEMARLKELSPSNRALNEAFLADTLPEMQEYLVTAIEHDPANDQARTMLVPVALFRGQLDVAKAQLDTLTSRGYDDPSLAVLKAFLEAIAGDEAAAQAAIQSTQQFAPSASAALTDLVQMLAQLTNDYDGYRRRNGIEEVFPDLLEHAAVKIANAGEALKQLRTSESGALGHSFPAGVAPFARGMTIGILALGSQNFYLAANALEPVVTQTDFGDLYLLLGLAESRSGQYEDAVKHLMMVTELPNLLPVREKAVRLAVQSEAQTRRFRSGDHAMMITCLKAYADLDAQNGTLALDFSRAAYQTGEYQVTIDLLGQALALGVDNAEVRLRLAQANLALEQNGRAEVEALRVLRDEEAPVEFRESAIEVLRAVVDAAPEAPLYGSLEAFLRQHGLALELGADSN